MSKTSHPLHTYPTLNRSSCAVTVAGQQNIRVEAFSFTGGRTGHAFCYVMLQRQCHAGGSRELRSAVALTAITRTQAFGTHLPLLLLHYPSSICPPLIATTTTITTRQHTALCISSIRVRTRGHRVYHRPTTTKVWSDCRTPPFQRPRASIAPARPCHSHIPFGHPS